MFHIFRKWARREAVGRIGVFTPAPVINDVTPIPVSWKNDGEFLSTSGQLQTVSDEIPVQKDIGEYQEDMVPEPDPSSSDLHSGLDSSSNADPSPVAGSSVSDEQIQQTSFNPSEEKPEDKQEDLVIEINYCNYRRNETLAKGPFGPIFTATRVHDGLKVAMKRVNTEKRLEYISIPGHPFPFPREVGLHMLACEGNSVPEIVQLLDWVEKSDHYVLVMEHPSPCVDLKKFIGDLGGRMDEGMAREIFCQAVMAANRCCMRGVFHRDIIPENLLVTTDTLQLKIIDFGCSDLLQNSPYKTFMGTRENACPEFFKTGEYKGEPATVYSLGVLLFTMLCGKFPDQYDALLIRERICKTDGLTKECCDLMEACLQEDPVNRIDLTNILQHKWFKKEEPANVVQTSEPSKSCDVIEESDDDSLYDDEPPVLHSDNPTEKTTMTTTDSDDETFNLRINGLEYEVGKIVGRGGFGYVYKGTRLHDGYKVAIKEVRKFDEVINDYLIFPGHSKPLPREVGLQMLVCEGGCFPMIVQFLDWMDTEDRYYMVLEKPFPCEDVAAFVQRHGGHVTEEIAQDILWQATEATEICLERGVFHRDIKMENLLIDPDTLEVKLIDFGCGDLFKTTPYKEYIGTREYACPEFFKGRQGYHAKPATVYSLGALLFIILCGRSLEYGDRYLIQHKIWYRYKFSEDCRDLIRACLHVDPEQRIDLENILKHKWFKGEDPANISLAPKETPDQTPEQEPDQTQTKSKS